MNTVVQKTIRLGTGLRTVDDFRKAIEKAGCNIDEWGNDALVNSVYSVSTEEIEVDLVVKSPAELGFAGGANRERIYARAIELGLELCPPEVGPQLRLQYLDQPEDEPLLIAMESINQCVFDVTYSPDGPSLSAYPGHYCNASGLWVFVQPRK